MQGTFTCDCWFRLWFEARWKGLAWGPEFWHDGRSVTHCPQCREHLVGLWHSRPAGRRTYPNSASPFLQDP